MTCNTLGGTRVAKAQISNECSHRHGEHDPAVIRHKKKPSFIHIIEDPP